MPAHLISSSIVCPDPRKVYPRISHGQGVYLYDESGKRYIDASGAASAVSILGHGDPGIVEALRRQAEQVALVPTHYFSTKILEDYVAALADFAPGDVTYAWTVSSGSEAVENSIKLARQYFLVSGQPQRYKVIGRWQSYHGATMQALDVGGLTARRTIYSPLMRQHPHIPPAYCYRCPFGRSPDSCALDCVDALEAAIHQEGPDTVAAFIAEPIVGAALGAVPAPRGYFQRVREICDRYGVLLIVDEVMSGFGRTGRNFAIEHWEITPDIMAVAKGMSGGYFPLGAILARERIVRALESDGQSFASGHTFACNPLGAAVGLYVLNYIKRHGLVERARILGDYLIKRLSGLLDLEIVGDVRGMGLLVGVEFVRDKVSKEAWPRELEVGRRVGQVALDLGLITYPGRGSVDGVLGDHIKIAPPLTIEKHELDEIVAILTTAIAMVGQELPRIDSDRVG